MKNLARSLLGLFALQESVFALDWWGQLDENSELTLRRKTVHLNS